MPIPPISRMSSGPCWNRWFQRFLPRPPIRCMSDAKSSMPSSTPCAAGVAFSMLPHEFPAWGTVYDYFRRWQREGIWDQVLRALRMQVRRKQDRDQEPSAAIIDSQSIKTSAVRGPEKGYDMGKKIWGRKRHMLVDTQGNVLAVKVLGADSSDQEGGRALLEPLKELLPRMKLVWGDSHYGGTFRIWAKITLGWTIQTIKALTVPKRGLLVSEGEEVDWEKLFP